jgi:NTP pyrophosphatase (non-canonical NTP hydrolase)
MEFKELMKRVADYQEKRFKSKGCDLTEEIIAIHLMEEMGEIASQLFSKKARPDKFNHENLKEEVCDVILVSLGLANLLNIDLPKELNKKLDIVFDRLGKY